MIDRAPFIRPSSLGPIELCPGRPLMEARAVAEAPAIEHMDRPAAQQGTMGHAVVAQTLALTYHQPGGWTVPDDALAQMAHGMQRLEPWTRDAVRRCVAYAVALVDEASQGEYDIAVQIEMHLSGQGIDIARGGTADLVLVCRDPVTGRIRWVIVADWKLGWLDQGHAADHLQLGAYATMAADKYRPDLGTTVHLAQGRRQEFSSAHYQPADIDAVRRRIRAAVAGAWAEAPELRPSIDACRYCKALTLCRPAREHIMTAIERAALFGAATPEDRVALAEAAAMARRFADDARDLAKQWQAENQSEHAKRTRGAA
jgi:hypothetical protein